MLGFFDPPAAVMPVLALVGPLAVVIITLARAPRREPPRVDASGPADQVSRIGR